MNTDLSKYDAIATQVEAFIKAHPIVRWLALAWLFGWIAALVLRIFIRMSPWNDNTERKLVFLSCIVFSAIAAGHMWDGDYPIIIASVMGGLSPFVYIALAELLCWKWPSLKSRLSLRKDFAAAVEDEPELAKEPTP